MSCSAALIHVLRRKRTLAIRHSRSKRCRVKVEVGTAIIVTCLPQWRDIPSTVWCKLTFPLESLMGDASQLALHSGEAVALPY